MATKLLRNQPDNLEHRYKSAIERGPFKLEEFDAAAEIRAYSQKIGDIVWVKNKSLHEAVAWVEEEVAKYAWNPKLTETLVDKVALDALNVSDAVLEEKPGYAFKVLPGQSGVHIPVEVYVGDPEVFHTLRWMQSLDNILDNVTNLHFVYFASVTGIFSIYPAFAWHSEKVDMFDIRKTRWYMQGSAVPKALLIMLDTSGSMTGQSLIVANISIQKLVTSLDENDYFAVGHFPSQEHGKHFSLVNNSEPACFQSFVRATKRNIHRLVSQEMTNAPPRGYANFSMALEEAILLFDDLKNDSHPGRENTPCNKVLVMFTDSAFEFDSRVMTVLKDKLGDIQLLVYALGEPVSDVPLYQRQAAKNGGCYQDLPSKGAVSNMMKDYQDRSTRVAHGPDGGPIQTSVILHGASEVFRNEEYQGNGLMISISTPVYNRSGDPRFLGMMGTDLPMEVLSAAFPQYKLGPLGYIFALNSNGDVLFHPTLRPKVPFTEDPPEFDWLDLEIHSDDSKTELRRRMIDQETGEAEITDFIRVTDMVHTYKAARKYAFGGIPQTEFGMAVVTPSDRHVYLSLEHPLSWFVTEDEEGAITVGNKKLERLLNKARVFLPTELVEKDWQDEEYFRHHMGQMAQEVDGVALMMNFKKPTVVQTLSTESLNESKTGAAMNSTEAFTRGNETMLQQVFRVLFKRELEEIYPTLEPSNVACLLNDTLESGENCPASITQTNNLTIASVTEEVVEEETPVTTPTTSSTPMDDLTIISVAEEETPTTTSTEATIEITENDSAIEVSENIMINFTPGSDLSTSSAFVSEPSAVEEDKDENILIKAFLKKVRNLKDVTPPQVSQVLFDLAMAEEDVSEFTATKSLPNSAVRSRTILLNSGLGWTIPKSSAEAFEDELTQYPISPILQRVYDSNRMIFWIPVRFGVPRRKFTEPENVTDGNATDSSYQEDTDTTLIDISDDESEVRSTEQMNVTEIPSHPVPVTVFKSVDLPWRDGLFKAGVMGLTLHPEFLPHHIRQHSLCSFESHNTCYLLDDAGYIVAVNNESLNYQIGHFLGAADPPLMRALLENNIYDSVIDYNFQGRCEPIDSEDAPESAGVGLKSFFLPGRRQALAVALFSYWWITDDLRFVKWPRAFATVILLPFGEAAAMQLEPSNCIQQIHRYFVPPQKNPDMFENITDSSSSWTRTTGGIINCSIDCVRDWKAVDIEGTNLKLIIASQACSENCSHLDERVFSGPVESDGPDVCQEVRNPRYRKSTGPCPLTDLVYTNLECGTCRMQCSVVLLTLSLLFVYFSPD
ncbi:hypothetical protein CRM22_004222 [Opisthorchis felineus]|uniref:VWFA domain-containing protein n=1 Tax=Opisthorchis felineus TaxID=147828 RepID=A0A4S2LXA1_OPIFE|nr:hypothetical protein CRM22_004222 [Opisthorchis felineus]